VGKILPYVFGFLLIATFPNSLELGIVFFTAIILSILQFYFPNYYSLRRKKHLMVVGLAVIGLSLISMLLNVDVKYKFLAAFIPAGISQIVDCILLYQRKVPHGNEWGYSVIGKLISSFGVFSFPIAMIFIDKEANYDVSGIIFIAGSTMILVGSLIETFIWKTKKNLDIKS